MVLKCNEKFSFIDSCVIFGLIGKQIRILLKDLPIIPSLYERACFRWAVIQLINPPLDG